MATLLISSLLCMSPAASDLLSFTLQQASKPIEHDVRLSPMILFNLSTLFAMQYLACLCELCSHTASRVSASSCLDVECLLVCMHDADFLVTIH
jgi:hypothetical protein